MDLGWATVRGRARWAMMLGIIVALGLIGGSLIALDRTVLPFNGWSSGTDAGASQQTLPATPPQIAIGATRSNRGTPATPGIPGATGAPLVPVLPTVAGGAGGPGAATGGTPAGTLGGTGGTGANGAAGGLDVGTPTAGAPGAGPTQPGVPRQVDSDNDGVPDATERAVGTNPTSGDTDGDGLPDGWERANGLDPNNRADAGLDSDGDGLRNA